MLMRRWPERRVRRDDPAGWVEDQRGSVALEFAIVLPVLLLCYLGGFEISQAIAAGRMTDLAVSTVVNIVSQYRTISASQTMPEIFNAATAVMTPYPVADARLTVSCIAIDAKGNATIAWSQSLNGTPRAVGAEFSLPAQLDVPNSSVILGEIDYAYQPAADYLALGTMNLSSSLYMAPRNATTITLTP